jgi:hypothetical protein
MRCRICHASWVVEPSDAGRDDRSDGIVLLDGSDRWRSLLLGAPPLLL